MISKTVKCVALCASALFLVSCGDSGPSKVAVEVNQLMLDGKVKDAMQSFNVSDAKRAQLTSMIEEKVLPKWKAEREAKGGVKSVDVVSETIAEDGQTAIVELKTSYGNGSTETESVNLEYVDGKWLVEDPFKNK
ncbi:MAG: DUF4878 domain-containing protein [Akkermansia sp.]